MITLAVVTLIAAGAHSKPAIIPKNTPVVVQTYNSINSATYHTGERLAYLVTNDVIVNGWLVARAGDPGIGKVLDAQQAKDFHAGAAGHLIGPRAAVAGAAVNKVESKGADLRVSVGSVQSFCGDTIPLQFIRSEYHHPKRFGKTPAVQIDKGQEYVAVVSEDAHVCGERTTRTPAPIPPNALHSDPNHGLR
ncbi:MAG TPA: hypothetical protein VFE17_00155 [Candidatus Baltobacteraceae bacterium]|jgi:hypothetical protein|nr:hypothetical protein [Candidatus Baltobacteraceae bacterium]